VTLTVRLRRLRSTCHRPPGVRATRSLAARRAGAHLIPDPRMRSPIRPLLATIVAIAVLAVPASASTSTVYVSAYCQTGRTASGIETRPGIVATRSAIPSRSSDRAARIRLLDRRRRPALALHDLDVPRDRDPRARPHRPPTRSETVMPTPARRRLIHRRTHDPKLGPPRSRGKAGVLQRAAQRRRLARDRARRR
jgi:hypothetical protein